MLALKEFRTTLRGTADLLNYAAKVSPDVVLLKDGGFLAGWQYQGDDRESATAHELAVLAAQVNAVLARLGTSWMLHVDAVRREATDYPSVGAFPDRGSALRLVTAIALNVTSIWTDRRYLDMSLLRPKEVAVAKAA